MTQLSLWLPYAGTLPFIFAALALGLGIETMPVLGNIKQVLSVYGLVIASFMAGSHWGQQLSLNQPWKNVLILTSNVQAIALWGAYVMLSFSALMLWLLLSFLLLLWVDYQLMRAGIVLKAYYQLRFRITAIVSIMLAVAAFA